MENYLSQDFQFYSDYENALIVLSNSIVNELAVYLNKRKEVNDRLTRDMSKNKSTWNKIVNFQDNFMLQWNKVPVNEYTFLKYLNIAIAKLEEKRARVEYLIFLFTKDLNDYNDSAEPDMIRDFEDFEKIYYKSDKNNLFLRSTNNYFDKRAF